MSVVASWVRFKICKLTKMCVSFSPVICSYRKSISSVVNDETERWVLEYSTDDVRKQIYLNASK